MREGSLSLAVGRVRGEVLGHFRDRFAGPHPGQLPWWLAK